MARPGFASMEPHLNRKNLIVWPLDRSQPKQVVWQELLSVCPEGMGKVVVSHDPNGGGNKGEAFLNFATKQDASMALDSFRYGLKVRGKPVHMTYTADRFVDRAVFSVLVKHLTADVEAADLHDKFAAMGEIFDIRLDIDAFQQYYGTVQYIEESSAHKALKELDNTTLPGHNIMIGVIYHPKRQVPQQQQQQQQAPPPRIAVPTPLYAARPGQPQPQATPAAQYTSAPSTAYGADGNQASGRQHAGSTSSSSAQPTPVPLYAIPTPFAVDLPVPTPSPAMASQGVASGGGAGGRQGLQDALRVAATQMTLMTELLCCPITQEVFREPVIAMDGVTYERRAIENWLLTHDTSPMSNEPLESKFLVVNKLVHHLVHDVL